MHAAILNDVTRCVGCQACVLACREVNELPSSSESDGLSARQWTTVERHQGVHVRRNCMHCLEPACAEVCPVAALRKTPEGPVTYDESRCIGCRYCMIACPFGIPKYEWDRPAPRVQKCVMCFEKRLAEGREPACTGVCPTGATRFGDRDALIEEARHRIAAEPGRYVERIYGLEEAGGTSVLYLSGVPFERLGFKTRLRGSPYPRLTWEILSKLPSAVGVGGVLLCGIWWISSRRDVLSRVEAGELTLDEALKRMPALGPGDDRGRESHRHSKEESS
jgi:formate dehydrogenase iron-sulfur subunit